MDAVKIFSQHWLEILTGAYLLGMVLYGHYKGFIRLAVSAMALLITLVTVRIAMPYVTDWLKAETTVYQMIQDGLEKAVGLQDILEGSDGEHDKNSAKDSRNGSGGDSGKSEGPGMEPGESGGDGMRSGAESGNAGESRTEFGIEAGKAEGGGTGSGMDTGNAGGSEAESGMEARRAGESEAGPGMEPGDLKRMLESFGGDVEGKPAFERAVIENLKLPDQLKQSLIENNNGEVYRTLGVELFRDYIGSYLTNLIVQIAVFLLLFLVIFILLHILVAALDLVARLPILSGMNKIAGAILGGLEGLFFVWIVCLIFTALSGTGWGILIMKQIEASPWLSFLYHNNLLAKIALGVIQLMI